MERIDSEREETRTPEHKTAEVVADVLAAAGDQVKDPSLIKSVRMRTDSDQPGGSWEMVVRQNGPHAEVTLNELMDGKEGPTRSAHGTVGADGLTGSFDAVGGVEGFADVASQVQGSELGAEIRLIAPLKSPDADIQQAA